GASRGGVAGTPVRPDQPGAGARGTRPCATVHGAALRTAAVYRGRVGTGGDGAGTPGTRRGAPIRPAHLRPAVAHAPTADESVLAAALPSGRREPMVASADR